MRHREAELGDDLEEAVGNLFDSDPGTGGNHGDSSLGTCPAISAKGRDRAATSGVR